MASATRMFFAGVGTTFAILAVGFGGGLMLAKSALDKPPAQTRASLEKPSPVRVVLPESTEPAQPPQQAAAVPTEPFPQVQPAPQAQPVPAAQPQPVVAERHMERADTKRSEREDRIRKRRYAERKAKQMARARQQLEEPQQPPEPGIMAFGVERPPSIGGFFGN